jgi:hypothetical protein
MATIGTKRTDLQCPLMDAVVVYPNRRAVFRLEDERAQNEGDHEQAAESQAKQTSHLSIVHGAEATQSRRRCSAVAAAVTMGTCGRS